MLRCPWHGYDYDPLTGKPPAGFSDAPVAYEADERLTSKLALEVLEFPDCAPPREETSFKRGDTG